ncbi:MAG: beta strand repeat-containing protein, partial [Frankiaceae bacterium]
MRALNRPSSRLLPALVATLTLAGFVVDLPTRPRAAVAANPTNDVSYSYDAAGRLAGVVDPAGTTARYGYDAAGNVTGVTNLGAPALSVLSFVPAQGAVGTSVTISGGPFATTPSANTVKFNGTVATVQSATVHQLVATVPSGATSGTISVTTSAGTATSASSFTLTTSKSPTISSFSPALVAPGDAVTLTGTNYDTTVANDVVTANSTYANVTTATATSLAVTAPGGTSSGRIAVRTAYGSTTSTGDLFIAPPPYLTTDVATTGRTALDVPQTVSIPTAGKIGLLVFDLPLGQRASVSLSGGTFGSCGLNATVLDPRSKTVTSTSCVGSSGFLDVFGGTSGGTYELLLAAQSTATGSISVTVNTVPADASAALTIDGAAQTVTTTAAGQNASLTFTGSAGQRVQLKFSGSTYPSNCCDPTERLYRPDGSLLWSASGATTLMDTTTLPSDGTYRVGIDPSGTMTGSITVQVWSVPADTTGTIAIDGPAQTVTTVAGQNAALTFTATAGQRVQLRFSGSTYPSTCCDPAERLYEPDGTLQWYSSGSTAFMDTTTLPADGTYKVVVDPSGTITGSITATLTSVPGDTTGTIAIDGPPQTITTVAGQNANLTFTATAGQRVQLQFSGSTYPSSCCDPTERLYQPDGTQLWATSGSTAFMDATVLSAGGTYRILIDPSGTITGSITATLTSVPADTSGSVAIDGPTQTVTTVAGQNAALTFTGTAGQRVQLQFSGSTYPSTCCNPTERLYQPNGTQLWATSGSTGFMDTTTLPADGTYKIYVDPSGTTTGSIAATLTSVPADVTTPITTDGTPATVTTVAGQAAALTFTGTTGQRIQLQFSGSTYPSTCCNPTERLYKPDGTQLWATSGSTAFMDTTTLPVDGTYKVLVDPSGTTTGSITLQAWTILDDVSATIAIDGPPQTVTTAAGQNAALTFSATAGQRVQLQFSGSTYPSTCCNPTERLYKPDGTQLWATSGGTAFMDTTTLPVDGTYKIYVDPSSNTTGSITATLTSVPADTNGTIVVDGAAQTVTTVAGQNANLTFTGTTGQRVQIQFSNSTYASTCCNPTERVYKPDGTQLWASSGSTALMDTTTLPADGTYKIVVDASGTTTGSITAQATSSSDVLGAIAIDGPTQTVTTVSGQNAQLSFTATAGQRVQLQFSSSTYPSTCCNPTERLYKPDGTQLWASSGSTAFMDTTTLPVSGTYKILVDPSGTTAGSISAQLWSVPPDSTGTIAIDGPAATATTVMGQNATLTFSATAGQRVQLQFSGSTYASTCCNPTERLYKPDGTQLWATSGSTAFMDTTTLPVDGTYQILVDPSGTTTGSITATLWSVPADSTGTIAIDGPAATATTVMGQNATLTFSATAGQRVQLQFSGSTYASTCCNPTERLYKPDGTQL